MRVAAAAIVLLLSSCAGVEPTTSVSELSSPTPSPIPASATPSASATTAGVARMCESFDIVTGTISPTYAELETDPIGLASAGLVIVGAGADIRDLADSVEPADLASDIDELGRLFQEEGLLVQDGDLANDDAISFYLDLVDEYGEDCD